jgi:hypothetical protein
MNTNRRYREALTKRADKLNIIAQSPAAQKLPHLTLPKIKALVKPLAQIIPADNVPTLTLTDFVQIPARKPLSKIIKQEIHLLFKILNLVQDTANYGTFSAQCCLTTKVTDDAEIVK